MRSSADHSSTFVECSQTSAECRKAQYAHVPDITRISLDLTMTSRVRLTSSRKLVFGGLKIILELTGWVYALLVYATAGRQFDVRKRDILMNTQCPHKWWSTLRSHVFSLSSSLPHFVGRGGGLVCESFVKANLLSAYFDRKQSRDLVSSPCHPSPSLTTFAFRSMKERRFLLGLDSYGGADPLGMFPLFYEEYSWYLAPFVSVWYFCGCFVWVAFLLAGDWLISPQFRKVLHPLQWPITDQFL